MDIAPLLKFLTYDETFSTVPLVTVSTQKDSGSIFMTEILNDHLILELKRGFLQRLSIKCIELQLRVTAQHHYWFKGEGYSILTV